MNIINQLKQEINSVIFRCTPPDWVDTENPHQWDSMKFKMEMELCQTRIKNLGIPIRNQNLNDGKKKIKELKKKVEEKIDDLKEELKNLEGNAKTEMNFRINELKSAVEELDKLIGSSSNFDIKTSSMPQLNYNPDTNTTVIEYDGNESSLLNELKHAFQFETGKIDFIKTSNGVVPGYLYDLNDELSTYKRQYAYDGFLKFRIAWTEEEVNTFSQSNITDYLQGKFNIGGETDNPLGILNINSSKYITADIIVKIKDGTDDKSVLYSTLSKESLDVNSTLKDIRSNNRKRKDLKNIPWLNIKKFKNKKAPYIEFIKVIINENPLIYVK